MWDRGLRVQNVSFINFPSSQTQALYGPSIQGRCSVNCGCWVTKFSQMSFTNVLNRGNFRWAYDGLYQDDDGSLHTPGVTILAPDSLWNTSSLCTPTPNFVNAISCPTSLGSWLRFAFNQCPLSQYGQWLFLYDSSNNMALVPFLHDELTHPNGYAMALLARRTYTLQFENANVKFLSHSLIQQLSLLLSRARSICRIQVLSTIWLQEII